MTASYKSSKNDTIITNSVYTISYNQNYKQPNWIEYVVRNLPRTVSRDHMQFYTLSGVKTSTTNDYLYNDYDRGHMAPAASFDYSYDALYKTFSYANCALQNKYLNRYVWSGLENQERLWAKQYDSVKVKIVLDFNGPQKILPSGTHIPNGFWKYIYFYNGDRKCYYFPNLKPTKSWQEYEIDCSIF